MSDVIYDNVYANVYQTVEAIADDYVSENRIKSESTKQLVKANFMRAFNALNISLNIVIGVEFDGVWLANVNGDSYKVEI